MIEKDFMVFSDMELMDPRALDYLTRKAAGARSWLMVQNKTDSVLHENSGRRRHGLGRNYWNRLLWLQCDVSSAGISIFLGFREKKSRRTLLEKLSELKSKRILCSCSAGCVKGELENCQFEPGGMVFFNTDDLGEFDDFDEASPIIS